MSYDHDMGMKTRLIVSVNTMQAIARLFKKFKGI